MLAREELFALVYGMFRKFISLAVGNSFFILIANLPILPNLKKRPKRRALNKNDEYCLTGGSKEFFLVI